EPRTYCHLALRRGRCGESRASLRGCLSDAPDVLRAEVGAHRSSISIGELVALKKRFGVSVQALTYRCKDLGIISPPACARLFKIFAVRGWRDAPYEEPESMAPDVEEPRRFERLCYRALGRIDIQDSQIS
ncbi:ImmA/IrrE family metallo-endopeptidase, partial [Shinella sp. AETb1-6]|uniref:ImmA/IrrE family metallo-endopeptidase n=1 Tax=Shinella sp. AETb1-6 TaxID=2692210 RepID=UPI00352FE7CE